MRILTESEVIESVLNDLAKKQVWQSIEEGKQDPQNSMELQNLFVDTRVDVQLRLEQSN